MEGFYDWIRNITYYLIFVTAAVNLLPNKKYEKYFRLFAGMVLILLVLKPFTGGLHLDDKLAGAFESISFQQEAQELRSRLSKMEGKRLESVIGQYEEAVENDLENMVHSSGYVCKKVTAVIDGNEADESFGHVVSIYMEIAGEKAEDVKNGGETVMVQEVEPVEPVQVTLERAGYRKEAGSVKGEGRPEDHSALAGLRRRISEYYNLEEQNIEIQMEDGKG